MKFYGLATSNFKRNYPQGNVFSVLLCGYCSSIGLSWNHISMKDCDLPIQFWQFWGSTSLNPILDDDILVVLKTCRFLRRNKG